MKPTFARALRSADPRSPFRLLPLMAAVPVVGSISLKAHRRAVLLPHPLRFVLSLRARRFDQKLHEVAARKDCHVAPLGEIKLQQGDMAQDGFHPGAPIYATWAGLAAEFMRPLLEEMEA